ncbi:MAG: MBL fold metallo-hydrolase [Candidatus Aegiribacteria sp.]|nr:MBL fold metallo-hydrolase [Candidatus Aegiribacteria sp.]MBD3295498.1 MBL fold metallo-hydrolase [Candidatus Fermentibacteria bacterium]
MLLERIESKGLAHYSYLLGSGTEALVIDPRRDCGEYNRLLRKNRMTLKYILETHRNEDYVIGSEELASVTGAEIWHADGELDYSYGKTVQDGQSWELDGLIVKSLSTPGHTPGSMSYLLHDQDGNPWICFTGDALFSGDTGRVDLMGMGRAREMAEMLYGSIFEKLIPLGDGVILCPAHGPGSVCGSGISGRMLTTIGMERQYNPRLQVDSREAFVRNITVELERPPYFRMMEKLNVQGPPLMGRVPALPALSAEEFQERAEKTVVLDTRKETCFASAHVPDSLSIWKEGVASYAGWFLSYDTEILLLPGGEAEEIARLLVRMGYDKLKGYLAEGIQSWHMAGFESSSIGTSTVGELCGILDEDNELFILDVRSGEELEEDGRIPGALHIHVTQLPRRFDEIPDGEPVYIFCGSGSRSMLAASYLKNQGFDNTSVILGGLAAWNSSSCPLEL